MTLSSPRKRGPMVPYTGVSGIWVPAYAGTTQCAVGNFVATVMTSCFRMAAISHSTTTSPSEEGPMPKNPSRVLQVMASLRGAPAALLLIAAAGATLGSARAEYPERQITMVACFPAGGGTDIAARLINTQLG